METTYFYAAAIGGIFLLFQFASMFIGGDDSGLDSGDADLDLDLDMGGDGGNTDSGWWIIEIISLRTLAAAATFFGLTGLGANAYGFSPAVTLVLAAIAGFASMYAVYWAFKQLFRLQSSGSENVANALGRPAQVYVPIPAEGKGIGKVHFEMQGRMVEYQATSIEDRTLATGEAVEVVGIVNADTVQVRSLDPAE